MMLEGEVPTLLKKSAKEPYQSDEDTANRLGAPGTVESIIGKLDFFPPKRQMMAPGVAPEGLLKPAILKIVDIWREETR